MRLVIGDSMVEILEGDLTVQNTQAIVNAANNSIMGSRGVDTAISRAAGPQVQEEVRKLGGLDFGDARVTSGGKLRAKYLIHTAGPIYRGGVHGEAEILARSYKRSLELAHQLGIKRIAFPAIGVGPNGYPPDEAAEIAIRTVAEFLPTHQELLLVRFVLNTRDSYKSFELALRKFLRR